MNKLASHLTDTPDCAKCIHFYITYDANLPYGCRAHGFKSPRKPQLDVLAASNLPCMVFLPRPVRDKQK